MQSTCDIKEVVDVKGGTLAKLRCNLTATLSSSSCNRNCSSNYISIGIAIAIAMAIGIGIIGIPRARFVRPN